MYLNIIFLSSSSLCLKIFKTIIFLSEILKFLKNIYKNIKVILKV